MSFRLLGNGVALQKETPSKPFWLPATSGTHLSYYTGNVTRGVPLTMPYPIMPVGVVAGKAMTEGC